MKIFLSHAAKDQEFAHYLTQALQKSGLDVWSDSQILPGDNWAAKVGQAMEESQVMVVLLTAEWLQSKRVQQEISYALGRHDYQVIPIVQAPLKGNEADIPWILRHFKMIPFQENGTDPVALEALARQIREFATAAHSSA